MSIWIQEASVENFNQRGKDSFSDHLGVVFTEMGKDFLAATMPITEKIKQPMGIMHGGASCVLAETVASSAANYCVEKNKRCVGLSINTNHIRPCTSGVIKATAQPIHLGKKTHVWEIKIKNEKLQLISITRLTLAVIEI